MDAEFIHSPNLIILPPPPPPTPCTGFLMRYESTGEGAGLPTTLIWGISINLPGLSDLLYQAGYVCLTSTLLQLWSRLHFQRGQRRRWGMWQGQMDLDQWNVKLSKNGAGWRSLTIYQGRPFQERSIKVFVSSNAAFLTERRYCALLYV